MKKSLWTSYARWIITGWIMILFMRIVEVVLLKQNQSVSHLLENELIGCVVDVVFVSSCFAFLFPFYYLFSRISFKVSNIFTGLVLALFSISHLSIIQYFVQTVKPLGGILFGHTFHETLFTIRASDTNYFSFGILALSSVLLIITLRKILNKINFSLLVGYIICVFSGLSIVFNVFINRYFEKLDVESQPYSIRINKSQYFYKTAASILFCSQKDIDGNTEFIERNLLFPDKEFVSKEYPLLSKTDYNDVLGAFLNQTSDQQSPNIVLLIVEGLGARFMHDFHGLELMPFLDSLAAKSLYWDKALTVGERSFNVVPSALASAPYGKKNFASENGKTLHLSLINLLSKQNYYSTFFYGQPQWFHDKGPFLTRNGIDKIIDSWCYPESYHKIMVKDYFWGYHDKDLVRHALEIIDDSLPESPRFDMYFTGSMHQPFIVDKEDVYNKRLDNLMAKSGLKGEEKDFINTYRKFVRTVLFSDDALRELFAGYAKHPSYKNTIFIITGDHPMSEIPIESVYKRYRVPIIIYSPLLKQAKTFHSVNSHLDILPTFSAYLHKNYGMEIPSQNAFIGKVMDTNSTFRNTQPIVFMSGDRAIVDILFENYFLSNKKIVFKVKENDEIEPVNDDVLYKKLMRMLKCFNSLNSYSCFNNRLIPDSIFYRYTGNTMIYKSEHQSYKMAKPQEFDCQVMPETEISVSGQYFFDFYVKSNEKFSKEAPVLVLESFDSKTNDRIFWNGFSLSEENGMIHFSFSYEKKGNNPMKIKSYFWNKDKVEFNLSNADCHLYRLTKQLSK